VHQWDGYTRRWQLLRLAKKSLVTVSRCVSGRILSICALLDDWSGSASILSSFVASSQPDIVIYTDASGELGYGALEVLTRRYGYGKWTKAEFKDATRMKAVSSTYLEVLAIIRGVTSFAKPNATVEVFSDSAAATFILQKRYDRKSEVSQAPIVSMDRFCRDCNCLYTFRVSIKQSNWWIHCQKD